VDCSRRSLNDDASRERCRVRCFEWMVFYAEGLKRAKTPKWVQKSLSF
jgi:hypothetical protein